MLHVQAYVERRMGDLDHCLSGAVEILLSGTPVVSVNPLEAAFDFLGF